MGIHYEGPTQPWALECTLYLCAQNISTTTTNHQTTQEIVSSWRNTSEADITYKGIEVYPPRNITFQQSTGLAVDSSGWEAMKAFFVGGPFDGTASYIPNGDLSYTGQPTMRPIYTAATTGTKTMVGGPPNILGGNIPLLFSQIATSMTNAMRSDNSGATEGSEGSDEGIVTGQATTMLRLAQVRWEWLTPPILVLILTWIFLGAVIWTNRKAKAVMWKSHALAVLAIDGGVGNNLKGCKHVESLAKRAESMRVRMGMSAGEVVLRETGSADSY